MLISCVLIINIVICIIEFTCTSLFRGAIGLLLCNKQRNACLEISLSIEIDEIHGTMVVWKL